MATAQQEIIPLHSEDIVVTRRLVERSVVLVELVTHTREQRVDEEIVRERVSVERVPVGRYVDAVPPMREEGDLTIIPVVEEVIVTQRKLLLREEVHVRRTRTTERHVETVTVREQEAVVTRLPARGSASY